MKNSRLRPETAFSSINKHGESLCGDTVEIVKKDDGSVILVLADGLGSGVKASILSTLTAKILSTMMAENVEIEDCVRTVVATLPVCDVRGIAYSTFTILHIRPDRICNIIQYDNPPAIILRNGTSLPYERHARLIEGKEIHFSTVRWQKNDVFLAMSDGAIHAGIGNALNFGWERDQIIEYMEHMYFPDYSMKTLTDILVDRCNDLYNGLPGDDTTVAGVRIRERTNVNMMVGPPFDPKSDTTVLREFFRREGAHVLSGGTTAKIAAKYLRKEIVPVLEYEDPEIPPIATIEGVDLVTEGIITLTRVLQIAREFADENRDSFHWAVKQDGASRLARVLLLDATDIHFYIGRAINPAHQNPALPIDFSFKMRMVEELAEYLKKIGKVVDITYN